MQMYGTVGALPPAAAYWRQSSLSQHVTAAAAAAQLTSRSRRSLESQAFLGNSFDPDKLASRWLGCAGILTWDRDTELVSKRLNHYAKQYKPDSRCPKRHCPEF